MYLIAVILVIVVIDWKEQIISNKKLLSCGGGPSCQPIIPERNIAKKNAVTVQEGATIWQVVDGKQREYAIFTEGKFILVNNW